MGKIIFIVGGQKGGVGKTTVCQALCQYFLDRDRNFSLVEGDAQIDDVGRMYRNQVETETVNISDDPAKASNPDVIYSKAMQDDKSVVVNLPSNILDVLGEWLKTTGLITILRENLEGRIWLVKLFVTDGCYESIRQLEKSVNMLGNSVPHVVIRNEGRVSAADFSYLDSEKLYTDILSAPNLIGVFDFPALEPGTRFYVDQQSAGLRAALKQANADSSFLRGQRIKNFIDEVTGVFDEVQKAIDAWFSRHPDWSSDRSESSSIAVKSAKSSSGGDSKGSKTKRKVNVKAGATP